LVSDQRSGRRQTITAELQLRRSGAIRYRAHGYDISATGCRIEALEHPWLGETVWVKFDGLETMEATVRSIDGSTTGLEFERPIDPRVLQLLIDRLR
jgi:hypothetical protein